MTARSLRRVGEDVWGTPQPHAKPAGADDKSAPAAGGASGGKAGAAADGKADAPGAPKTAASTGQGDPKPGETPPPPKEDIEELKAELDSYIGLSAVKDEVRDLINMVTVWKLRREHDLPAPDLSLHMVFSGNPGTGKTMMARFMARVYHSLGILSKGHLVEVDRSGLVAGYVGQTAIKTASVIERAKGGVLFIDEAYSLSSGKAENDFGLEAIETLLKAMEDNRDDLIVIVAGYTDLMEEFINSNPGLSSRFNRYLYFDDYTVDEMLDIFELQCEKNCYVLSRGEEADSENESESKTDSENDGGADKTDSKNESGTDKPDSENESGGSHGGDARAELRRLLEDMSRDPDFGNARGVRNLFERILIAQANRLAEQKSVTRDELMTITADDIRAL